MSAWKENEVMWYVSKRRAERAMHRFVRSHKAKFGHNIHPDCRVAVRQGGYYALPSHIWLIGIYGRNGEECFAHYQAGANR